MNFACENCEPPHTIYFFHCWKIYTKLSGLSSNSSWSFEILLCLGYYLCHIQDIRGQLYTFQEWYVLCFRWLFSVDCDGGMIILIDFVFTSDDYVRQRHSNGENVIFYSTLDKNTRYNPVLGVLAVTWQSSKQSCQYFQPLHWSNYFLIKSSLRLNHIKLLILYCITPIKAGMSHISAEYYCYC